MTFDYGAAIRERIAAEVAEHGEVPPPWAAFPSYGPHSLGWRMGDGELYSAAWTVWSASLDWSEEQRLAYLRRSPAPAEWRETVACFLWNLDVYTDAAELAQAVACAEALGL
ncbi:hypothetical protein Deipr_0108 [Deinococcus proteolyticus MRP]|uniref:Uncharacterized protein n=1 Tax=Deinococcus proteolyticus (strain ATCC 35074 / DSM 20540 / JCM 6276 / NBRC 101906 / NCIMB 13154 / VKM Ac-1939 / CCM 2703 / MRP) TaxID=693977 RepID=F0RNQ0_DEIPM|nr:MULTISPECIES: hypothetical protein [Deinococcus]ADY25283.1 hypothetical protein Deipr_0108 [Deinococcus proteolyticus MRP]MCY1703384.1 hypothetical protein [Deinococcus sp. SL84]